MNHHLDRLIALAKKSHDRLIIHNPNAPHDDLVLVPLADYEQMRGSEPANDDLENYFAEDEGLESLESVNSNHEQVTKDDVYEPVVRDQAQVEVSHSKEEPISEEPIFLEEPI